MVHVYSQDRDLVVYLFINQLISYLLTFSRGGGGGGGGGSRSFHNVFKYRFIYFCLYHKLELLAI